MRGITSFELFLPSSSFATDLFLLVLYGISVLSIVLLLLTTYVYRVRWHPVVSVILWMAIPYAIVALLHYPLHNTLSERLPIPPLDRPLDQQHTGLAYFCAAEAILLYIFSAVGSGLTVSFMLSLFVVVVKPSHPKLATSPQTWRSFRWLWDASTTTLCTAPFVWALPLVVASIEALVRTSQDRYPAIYYSNTFCNIDDYVYQAVSGVVLGLPLIVATILVIAILCMLVLRRIRGRGPTTQLLNAPLAVRFAAIVIQIFITGIITLCELALKDDKLRGTFRFHLYWTALTPLITFCIFGTQQDLLGIWKYWAYRIIGREPTFTPRSSNEAQTLSNSSARDTTGVNQHVIRTQDMYNGDGKAHKASSSAGRADSMSISDPLAPMTSKRSHGPSELGGHADTDLESNLSESGSKHGRRGTTTAIPDLPYLPETPHGTTLATPSPHQTQFYSAAGAVSSQGLVSSLGHSGTRGLLSPQADLAPPTIVVTGGFSAVFGAQVPSSARGGMMGRPIITREERERRLAAADNARQQYPWAGGSRERERTRSTGLPPPPRSPRQSNARPLSAGVNATLERESLALPRPSTAGSAKPTSWGWDSPFPLANTSTSAQRARASDGGSGSHHGSDQGIEMEEKIKTPSDGSFERGHSRKESHEKASSGPDPRDSWMSKDSRMSSASDRTFG